MYGNASVGAAFTESGNTSVTEAIDLLVANIEGDSRPEILLLVGNSLGIGREIRVYSQNLQLLRTLELEAPASVIAAEPGEGSHRNILVGSGSPYYYYSDPPNTEVRTIDSASGARCAKSPALPGLFSKNSLRTIDFDGNGVYEIVYGTSAGMNVTR